MAKLGAETFWRKVQVKNQWNDIEWRDMDLLSSRDCSCFWHPGTTHHIHYYNLHVEEKVQACALYSE